ncbi:MAG: ribosome silencing factor [Chloroflexota bacterium]|nr:ribosome silencing factor [Dehalococcoidia bacterium]MDW8253933.1 ribosome silencing factor [Chloroflexota bacterium]
MPSPLEHEALDSLEIGRLAVEAAVDKHASNIVMLDVRKVVNIADYFVICTAETARQINAVVEGIEEAFVRAGIGRRRREGETESGWVLLDYGDVIVHVFAPAERDYYRLERLWRDAPPVVQIQ